MELFRQYFDVFGPATNRELLRLALGNHERFRRSKTTPNRYYPHWRKSTVIYDDRLRDIKAKLKLELMARLPETLASLQLPQFEIGDFELQLTSHNDGEYYKWHTDNGTAHTATRVVTFVYYFHRVPKRYSGGELVLHPASGATHVVEPQNDSLVLFGSHSRHEVRPVVCPSEKFEHGRFTLNGWIRRKPWAMRNDSFGYQIFAPYRPKRPVAAAPGSAVPAAATAAAVPPAVAAASALEFAALRESNAKYASLLGVYGRLQRLSAQANAIDVRPRITQRHFVEDYYSRNRALILKGLLRKSPAVRMWSPNYFAKHFADARVEITANRDGDHLYERHFRQSVQHITMGELCARLSREPESNDFYLVARNFFFDNPAFERLREELSPPAQIIDATRRSPGSAKLWFGPKGTVTPLHHDEHSILFIQIYGRKHFKLIPSFELPRMYVEDKFYSAVDPELSDRAKFPDFPFESIMDATLEPGDALFIPVGWWHWVRSLDVSISATFCNFRVPGRNTEWRPTR